MKNSERLEEIEDCTKLWNDAYYEIDKQDFLWLLAQHRQLQAQVKRLREALEYYADPGKWFSSRLDVEAFKVKLKEFGCDVAKRALEDDK